MSKLKSILRIAAGALAAMVIIFWLVSGAHMGWSRTSNPVEKIDPITEIEFVDYEDKFVPGIDFVIAGLGASFAFVFVSFFIRNPNKTIP